MTTQQQVSSAIVRRQSLTASISKACLKCNAPGVYQNNESFIKDYPDIFRPLWAGKDVGPVCPCCGANRNQDEQLGEIWAKEWIARGSIERVIEKVKGLFKK